MKLAIYALQTRLSDVCLSCCSSYYCLLCLRTRRVKVNSVQGVCECTPNWNQVLPTTVVLVCVSLCSEGKHNVRVRVCVCVCVCVCVRMPKLTPIIA